MVGRIKLQLELEYETIYNEMSKDIEEIAKTCSGPIKCGFSLNDSNNIGDIHVHSTCQVTV